MLVALRQVLDASLVVQRFQMGSPKSFLPLTPELITHKDLSTVFRDLGKSVVDGLWQRSTNTVLCASIRERVQGWGKRHPLSMALHALCDPKKDQDRGGEASHLSESINKDSQLSSWVRETVAQDWQAWLKTSEDLSVDEQIETMVALIGLHLHIALLWRLRDLEHPAIAPCYFVSVAGHGVDPACVRAGYNCYAFWGDRAGDALKQVAATAIETAASYDTDLDAARRTGSWTQLGMWAVVTIKGKSKKATQAFQEAVKTEKTLGESGNSSPAPGQIAKILVKALVGAFSGASGVVSKVKDYLRTTGGAVGLVGPDAAYSRKRYMLNERALSLLARLHAERAPETIRSNEEEKKSIEAFLDDIFERYGIIVTREREVVKARLARYNESPMLRSLLKHLPGEEAVRSNRALFDRRLDELRLVRRYSDASAVIYAP